MGYYVTCSKCGWTGLKYKLKNVIIYNGNGDMYCLQCPQCKSVEKPKDKLFVERKEDNATL